jgi:hypothetical protein
MRDRQVSAQQHRTQRNEKNIHTFILKLQQSGYTEGIYRSPYRIFKKDNITVEVSLSLNEVLFIQGGTTNKYRSNNIPLAHVHLLTLVA